MPVPAPTSQQRRADAPAAAADPQGKNIWVAAGEGDLERVRELVEQSESSPSSSSSGAQQRLTATTPDAYTYTPLHAASSYGHVDVLRYLLSLPSSEPAREVAQESEGEDGDDDDDDAARRPPPTRRRGARRRVGGAVNVTDDDGDTPLFVAERVDVARCLVDEFGADVYHVNAEGMTAASAAEENGHEEVAAYLRSVTGEGRLYGRGDDGDGGDGGERDRGGPSADADGELDAALERRTEELMRRVEAVVERARARGARSGEELDEDEERELRSAVGEEVLRQIREGWVGHAEAGGGGEGGGGGAGGAVAAGAAPGSASGTGDEGDEARAADAVGESGRRGGVDGAKENGEEVEDGQAGETAGGDAGSSATHATPGPMR